MREEDAGRATDATIAEFSIQLPHGQTLYGEVPVEVPAGQRTRTLVELGNTLVDYCKAKSTDRTAIATKLEGKATSLLKILENQR